MQTYALTSHGVVAVPIERPGAQWKCLYHPGNEHYAVVYAGESNADGSVILGLGADNTTAVYKDQQVALVAGDGTVMSSARVDYPLSELECHMGGAHATIVGHHPGDKSMALVYLSEDDKSEKKFTGAQTMRFIDLSGGEEAAMTMVLDNGTLKLFNVYMPIYQPGNEYKDEIQIMLDSDTPYPSQQILDIKGHYPLYLVKVATQEVLICRMRVAMSGLTTFTRVPVDEAVPTMDWEVFSGRPSVAFDPVHGRRYEFKR